MIDDASHGRGISGIVIIFWKYACWGKTYKLMLDFIPVGQTADVTITTMTVNIQVAK